MRGRLAGLARGWGDGYGPRAILACPPGEQHDLGLMAYGIMLHRTGWRVHYLGTDTPVSQLTQAITEIRPALAVLAAVTPSRYIPHTADLAKLAALIPLGLAGAGATQAITAATGARLLPGDPVREAHRTPDWAIQPG